MRRVLLLLLIGMLAAAGCIKPRPKTGPQAAAPMDVPPPPPRVIALPEPEEPAEETAPAEPEPAKEKPRGTRPRPQGPRTEPAKPAEVKPDALPPVEVVKPPVTPPPPAQPLQPALQGASLPEVQKQVQAQLAQARGDLKKVDQRNLSADGKTQYQTASQFIAQADAALKEGNLVFAQKLAEKAVGLASNLVPR